MALECGETREAERLIAIALSGMPPDEIAEELRDLLETVYFYRHLKLRKITLAPNEFQFSLSGRAVGAGITESDAFFERIQNLRLLLDRTVERKSGLPFRERGRPKIQTKVNLYMSVPRAASFAVSLRLGSNEQLSFLQLVPGLTEIVDDLLDCFKLFNDTDVTELKHKIKDDDYLRNFVVLARKIAPDGENIQAVNFTSFREGAEWSTSLNKPRRFGILPEFSQEQKKEVVTVRGTLKYADARKEEGLIQVVDTNGTPHKFSVPTGIADIVRPLWEFEVEAIGTRSSKKDSSLVLQDIQKVPD